MDVVSDQVKSEVQAARLLVTLPSAFVKYVHVSLICLVPKGHNTSSWRTKPGSQYDAGASVVWGDIL